tara:strand:- start:74 stop:214 length:141 start_codon:yes stop_codon:yes gene_type:complete
MPLTEKQKKLPPALQKAILAKQEKDSKKPKMPPTPKAVKPNRKRYS